MSAAAAARRAWRRLGLFAGLACVAAGALAQDAEPRTAFRVCQDPNNMPFSNTKGEGYEDRIAQVFAKDLGLPVTYYSFPQRMAFIRNTLRFKLPGADFPCDIVMNVPKGFDQVLSTKPYYRSTYALVFAPGKGMDAVRSEEDFLALPEARLHALRIGIYDRSPASAWLVSHRLVDQGVPYKILNADPDQYPGQMIENDLAQGKLDVAIVWGPIAGYFAKHASGVALTVVPLHSEPGVKLDFEMAMGVRFGESAWKKQIEELIDRNQAQIHAILAEYGVPQADAAAENLR
jgi:mxaJ protein